MRRAEVYQQGQVAGWLEEITAPNRYRFTYADGYVGEPVSLTMPAGVKAHEFDRFPPVFEGLLPEGAQLEALLWRHKVDRDDLFSQLMLVGEDLVGSLQVRECG